MEINEITILDDRGFVHITGDEAKDFLQNIVTNDIEKINENFTIFSSILTPQGKYLYEFFILKLENEYLLECEKESTLELIKIFNFYKLRSKVNLTDVSNNYTSASISLKKAKEINDSLKYKANTIIYKDSLIFTDPRNENLGAKIVSKTGDIKNIIKSLNLKKVSKENYYIKSFNLGIAQINLGKLKDKVFGIENNLDELNGIDFKKGCYIGQENTSRIKLRNKLRRRILPVIKFSGDIYENNIIKFKGIEVGKIIIEKPYPFALIKVIDPDLKEFVNTELECGKSKVKIIKPNWI
jgi:folate-binding protein YgfZ